jgi:hypothetical protein
MMFYKRFMVYDGISKIHGITSNGYGFISNDDNVMVFQDVIRICQPAENAGSRIIRASRSRRFA